MLINIAGIEKESIVDGSGIRFVVFTQGCPHHCVGCHNPETHDFNGGHKVTTQDLIQQIQSNPLLAGVTLSGGEPFCQTGACLEIARAVHKMRKNVWCYTGYKFEEIRNSPLLNEIDVLVDGKFEYNLKSLEERFRGSTNQRIINVPISLKQNRVVLL